MHLCIVRLFGLRCGPSDRPELRPGHTLDPPRFCIRVAVPMAVLLTALVTARTVQPWGSKGSIVALPSGAGHLTQMLQYRNEVGRARAFVIIEHNLAMDDYTIGPDNVPGLHRQDPRLAFL